MYLTDDYKDIIYLFNKYNVEYLIVGAYAMAVFGYSRSTYDIDLWIDKSKENIEKVLNALEEFGIPFEISKDDLQKENSVIQIGIAPNRIDILTDIDGVDFKTAYKNRVLKDLDGIQISILNIDDLIKNKQSSNRAKDKIDIIELKKLKNKS